LRPEKTKPGRIAAGFYSLVVRAARLHASVQASRPHYDTTSHQFAHRRMVRQVLRSSGRVVDEMRGGVEAEVLVDSGQDFAMVDRTGDGVFAQAVGGADGLAGVHTAARHKGAADRRPVVAAGAIVDPRRAAEFAPGNHG